MLFSILFALLFAQDCPNDWTYGVPNDNNLVADSDHRRNLIVSGQESTPHEYPWQVALRVGTSCGGSIIGREWILTAAHCNLNNNKATVIAGLNGISIEGKFISHPNYDEFSNLVDNDIALIKLDSPLPCDNPNIRPISLLDKSNGFNIDDCSAWVTGFGALYSGGTGPVNEFDNFEVQTRMYDTATCNQASESYYTNLPSSQLCGFTPGKPTEDSCQGDSGGPFILDKDTGDSSHEYVQAGIVSYGNGCGSSAGVYTDVSEFKNWILGEYSGAVFTSTNECDRNHYHEGIVECEGTDNCQLKLPSCQANADEWRSSNGRDCGYYSTSNARCYADHSDDGVFAYQICHQCTQCIGANGQNSDWSGDPNNSVPTYAPPTVPSESNCADGEELVTLTLFSGYYGNEVSANVNGDQCIFSGTFDDSLSYTGTCCLDEGRYILNCLDSFGDGWNQAYMSIGGTQHCNSFSNGYSATSEFVVGVPDFGADLGCGVGNPAPSGCDNQCGSTKEDLGCGCGEAGPSGCDNKCGSTKEDLGCGCGEAGPSGCDDQCGSTKEDLGCGCGKAGPSGCDNKCGSTKEDLGCGCGEAGPSGCDNKCGSTKVDAGCGCGITCKISYTQLEGDFRCIGTTKLYFGRPGSADQCRALCDENDSCRYYAQWNTGRCETYSECPSTAPDGSLKINRFKKLIVAHMPTCENEYHNDAWCDAWKPFCPGGTKPGYEDWMERNCCKACSTGAAQERAIGSSTLSGHPPYSEEVLTWDILANSNAFMVQGLAILGVFSTLAFVAQKTLRKFSDAKYQSIADDGRFAA